MKKIIKIIIIIAITIVVASFFINIYMIESTKDMIINVDDKRNIKDVDAIVVLGCKAYDDYPSLMLQYRLNKGIEVYNELNSKLLLTGDHGKKDYDEVNVMKKYVLSSGIDENDIFLDHAGFNTYDSLYRVKEVFNAKKIVIITQKYHLYRALYIAHALNLEAYGIIADDIPYKSIMLKNEIREVLSRDKNFFKVIFKPKSKYLGEKINLDDSGVITQD